MPNIIGTLPSEPSKITRRLLLQVAGAGAFAMIGTPVKAVADTLLQEQRIRELLGAGLDIPENMDSLRSLIKSEIAQAYRDNPQEGFPPYDVSKIDSDAVFFGNVRGDISNQIRYNPETQTHYDNRIKGIIDFHSPQNLLSKVDKRVLSLEASGNIAFIVKDQYGTDTFIYYEAGILKYVFPTTLGKDDATPDTMIVRGTEKVGERKLANYYHIGNKKGPMPYSRRLRGISKNGEILEYDGINTHIGNVAPGEDSAGCARQGALGAALLFHTMKPDTIIYKRSKIHLDPES